MGEEEEMNTRVVQNILAPVYGHVAGGNITVVEHPPQEREPTWWDLSQEELHHCLKIARAERWQAWRQYWFNAPFFLIGALCLCLLVWAWSLLTGGFAARLTASSSTSHMWLFAVFGVNFGAMLPLAAWLNKIRRVEAHVAAHAQADIDAIEVVLRRRR